MTVRATKRRAERTSLDGERFDVIVCGASFAGLAVARELAGAAGSVLIVDRYEIGERATSACAAPTPWLEAMGVASSIRQELPCMRFSTPYGSFRYRLPWSWSSFDYRALCLALWEQCGDARFETAVVQGPANGATNDGGSSGSASPIGVLTDRGTVFAPLVVDALGWRRVLARSGYQPPDAPLSRGLEVHPHASDGVDLDVWIERPLVRRGYLWRVPAGDEQRVGAGSYEPRHHVKQPTQDLAARLDYPPERYQGNWFPHRLRDATEDGVFFVGDSAGHCFPLSGEGIRTAFYFGIACGRELRAVLAGERARDEALERYHAFSARHAPAFKRALQLQRLIPALPPRALTALLRAMSSQRVIDRSFRWYLDQAHPSFANQASLATRSAPSSGGVCI
ncbi:MAG: NAD(P)/FAD-dependent oxidoreductase [Solirubrobacteraceae bacterium]